MDGLVGWWLCSLHGKQGIAPGNRLQEIKRRLEEQNSPESPESNEHFTFEEIDYDVPKCHDPGEDYAVPRELTSPDYDVPNANRLEGCGQSTSEQLQELENQFNNLPGNSSLNDEIPSKSSGIGTVLNNQTLSDDVYDVPTAFLEDDLPQEVYDVPQPTANKEETGFDKLAKLDNNTESSAGGMCNVPDQGVSRGTFEGELPSQAPEEPDIYAEIYDVPSTADHEKTKSFERQVNRANVSPNTNKNSIPQETSSVELSNHATHLSTGVSGDSNRQSTSSTDSAKLSSDDDYVDYQDIYGDGRVKDVSIYDVPVQVSINQSNNTY